MTTTPAPTPAYLKVGSTVRAPVAGHPKVLRRAMIATLHEDSSSACLLWEDDAVATAFSLIGNAGTDGPSAPSTRDRYLARKYLLAPELTASSEENESIVPLSSIRALLAFEYTSEARDVTAEVRDAKPMVRIWKDRGDQLLLLGDAAAAIPYYERALQLSSLLQVGSSILVKEAGYVRVADVDCLDDSDKTVEITMVETQVERDAREQDILLCVMVPDEEGLQERILLNLSRCLLQLADVTTMPTRRPLYLSRSILGCTMAISVSQFHHNCGEEVPSLVTEKKALLLRSQAQAGLHKYKHALADLRKVLATDPQHKEALKLQNQLTVDRWSMPEQNAN